MTRAQWQLDGTAVCLAQYDQIKPIIVADGSGGAFIAWADGRNLNYAVIYVQRVNSSGVALWTADGIPISNPANSHDMPAMVADGAGGVIVTWVDYRAGNADVYAQRLNASGITQWAVDGVALYTAVVNISTYKPQIASDGSGGAIVTWFDARDNAQYDIYAQRVNASGVVQWTSNGVLVSTATDSDTDPAIVADGSAGAIITWDDRRNGNDDIYAQRINTSGTVQWTSGGVALCTEPSQQLEPNLVSDGASGAIVTWWDLRAGNYDIFAQRINGSGAVQWTSDGVALCTASGHQYQPKLVTDAAGGAIVTWSDLRGANYDVYAQRVNATGTIPWTPNGIAVCTATNGQLNPAIVADGSGGALIAWDDTRTGPLDIYAQHIQPSGSVLWAANGIPFSVAANHQRSPAIATNGAGGAIVVFQDARADVSVHDIYAQRIDGRYGYWGRLEPILDAASDNPNDQGGKVALNFRASGRDVPNEQLIYTYTIWRALDEAAMQALVSSGAVTIIHEPANKSARPAERVVWQEQTPATNYYWELIGSQPANYDEAYSFLASTRQDSVASNPATHYFRVVAQGVNQFYNWPSNVLSAHSVDNLAPAAPLFLTALRSGSDVHLKWNRVHASDLKNYAVYRATSTGVTPVPVNFLADNNDTLMVDSNAPTGALYYIVTARDVHQNQSGASNEAAVGAVTGVGGNLPPITALIVMQNYPNPFTSETELMVGLPAKSDIRVQVYDVAGRRVREVSLANQASGWRRIRIDSRDDRGRSLASGVYFYRVHAGNETVTKKMVITR